MLPFIVSDYFMNNLLKRTFNLCLPNIVFVQKCNIKQLLQGKKCTMWRYLVLFAISRGFSFKKSIKLSNSFEIVNKIMSNDRSSRHYPKRKLVIVKGFLFALARYSADCDVTKKRCLIGQNTIFLTTLYQLLRVY